MSAPYTTLSFSSIASVSPGLLRGTRGPADETPPAAPRGREAPISPPRGGLRKPSAEVDGERDQPARGGAAEQALDVVSTYAFVFAPADRCAAAAVGAVVDSPAGYHHLDELHRSERREEPPPADRRVREPPARPAPRPRLARPRRRPPRPALPRAPRPRGPPDRLGAGRPRPP